MRDVYFVEKLVSVFETPPMGPFSIHPWAKFQTISENATSYSDTYKQVLI